MRSVLAFVPAIAFAASAAAQPVRITSPYRPLLTTQSLGPAVAYLRTGRTVPAFGPQDAPLLSLRYTVRLSGPLELEARAGLAPSQRTLYAPDPSNPLAPPQARGDVPATLALGEGAFRFRLPGPRTWHRLSPFLTAGFGVVADLRRSVTAEDSIPPDARFRFGTRFAVSTGAGTEWYLGPRWAVVPELRLRWWRLDRPRGLQQGATESSAWVPNLAVELGLAYTF